MLLLNCWNGLKGHFAEIELKHQNFLNIKSGAWDLKILLFDFWNDIALGSAEIYFLEVGACVSLEQATTGLWEGRFCWIWLKISHFLKYKNGGVQPKNFIA